MTEFNGELPSRGGSRLQLHVEDTCNGMWGARAPTRFQRQSPGQWPGQS